MKKRIYIYTILCTVLLWGCDDAKEVTEELYFHQVYINNAHKELPKTQVSYSAEGPTRTSFSVATGGSTLTDKDIVVTFSTDNEETVEDYNWRNVAPGEPTYQVLDKDLYELPASATIKAGKVYEEVFFTIKTATLEPDSFYIIPISIKDVSAYVINETNPVLMFMVDLVNDYSGSYTAEWIETNINSGNEEENSQSRALKAVSEHAVRMYHKETEIMDNADPYGVVFTVDPSSYKVTVSAWKDFPVTGGEGVYDPEDKSFTIWYTYMDGNTEKRMDVELINQSSSN